MFGRKKKKEPQYNAEKVKPVLRKSICTGETTAGFMELSGTRKYHEIILIKNEKDLKEFMDTYGIDEIPDTVY